MMNAGPLIESRIRHCRCIIDISADNLSGGWAGRSALLVVRRWWSQLVAMDYFWLAIALALSALNVWRCLLTRQRLYFLITSTIGQGLFCFDHV